MAANRHLHPDQFRFDHDTQEGSYGVKTHAIHTFHPQHLEGKHPVGSMVWSGNTGEIHNVYVLPRYERQGIASRMYQHARENFEQKPVHSDNFSDEKGRNWAAKVGGPSIDKSKRKTWEG